MLIRPVHLRKLVQVQSAAYIERVRRMRHTMTAEVVEIRQIAQGEIWRAWHLKKLGVADSSNV